MRSAFDCECVVGRIYVDLLAKTSPGSKVAMIRSWPTALIEEARRGESSGPAAQADDVGFIAGRLNLRRSEIEAQTE
jgi:hypothetical protein